MLPELNQAIIKHLSDYFTWDRNRQEQYRVNIPEDDIFKVKQFLLKAIFDITVTDEDQMDEAKGNLTDVQSTKFNTALLPLQGIGENFFWLNENFADPKTLLSFATLYDYDFDDHQFQQDVKERDLKGYQRKSYRGSLYLTWARLMIKERFHYATLTMAPGYVYCELDDYGQDYIEGLIPYAFVEGKNHGDRQDNGYLWDYKTDANGLEPQLEELEHRFRDYLQETFNDLENEFDKESLQQVLIFNESTPDEPCYHFVFTDKKVLKKIHFKTFMRDCWDVEQKDYSGFAKRIDDERQKLKIFLNAQYQDIMTNFNPNVLRFKKKYKIVCHKDSGLV